MHLTDLPVTRPKLDLGAIIEDPEIPKLDPLEMEMFEVVAEGGFARVYRAIWNSKDNTSQEVAVKMLKIHAVSDVTSLQDFCLEIKLLSQLKHRNVLRFFGAACFTRSDCEQLSIPFDSEEMTLLALVTEYCKRGNLRQVLCTPEMDTLPLEVKLEIALGIARGMLYLHANGIIHRDLKPENLLVTWAWEIKIADFGISTFRPKHEQMLTKAVGTPIYMAPEVMTGGQYTQSADVYSFAIVLVQVVSTVEPYSESSLSTGQLLFAIEEGLRPKIPANLPRHLHVLITECWDTNPRKRPSFEEIYRRLKRFID